MAYTVNQDSFELQIIQVTLTDKNALKFLKTPKQRCKFC